MLRSLLRYVGRISSALSFALIVTACAGTQPSRSNEPGSMVLGLILPSGEVITTVDYSITAAALSEPRTGIINVHEPSSGVSVAVGALPAAAGYLVTLSALTSDRWPCAGSAGFEAVAGQTSAVSLALSCRAPTTTGSAIVSGVTINNCPKIDTLVAVPTSASAGSQINLAATFSDIDGNLATVRWTASSGALANPNSAMTTYDCVLGTQRLTATVDDGNGCQQSGSIDVQCTPLVCQPCDAHANCVNIHGTATCVCAPGYVGTGTNCADIDECATQASRCSGQATCTNTPGAYTCTCNPGYQGDGFACADVDECAAHSSGCSAQATCINTPGSFTCACNAGYQGTGVTCADIDECAAGIAHCGVGACVNTAGAFTCTCPTGYRFDGLTCADVDECATPSANICGTTNVCENTDGSYYCLPRAMARVSLSTSRGDPNGQSMRPSFSQNGRYIAYDSVATNLVAGDTNAKLDVFVYDRLAGTTTRASVSSTGAQGDDSSFAPSISGDGRYVAFHSHATNLVAGDTNNTYDVFVRDLTAGTTVRASVTSAGLQASGGDSMSPSISSDGRFLVFQSLATNLVAGDTNAQQDVFLHDMNTGATTRISVSTTGTQADQLCSEQAISSDGRFAAFSSFASTLVAGDTNGLTDVFVRDLTSGVLTRISLSSAGAQGNQASFHPVLSQDARYVAFTSNASNLVANDTAGFRDVFVRDRNIGTTTRESVATAGTEANNSSTLEAISADGRYLTFSSLANNLAAPDTNNVEDIFARDRVSATTVIVSVSATGVRGNGTSTQPTISPDGSFVGFYSLASNLVPADGNSFQDIFTVANPLKP